MKKDLPFSIGETLTYRFKVGNLPAGELTLSVLPIKTFYNKDVFHFQLQSKTYSIFDMIYKIEYHLESYVDHNMQHSVRYKKKSREGKLNTDAQVLFHVENNEAQYIERKKKYPPVTLMPSTFDPLAAFYAVRCFDFGQSHLIEYHLCDGKRTISARSSIKPDEKLNMGGKQHDTFLIEPTFKHIFGVVNKHKNSRLKIWISADQKKIPLRLKSKSVIGGFSCELIDYKS